MLPPPEQSASKDAPVLNGKVFPLSHYLSYQKFNPSFQVFTSSISLYTEPTSYKQALKDPGWCQAMEVELEALEHNQTWILIDLPPGKEAIDC